MITRIETERLILRKPKPEDYPAWEAFTLNIRSRFVRPAPTKGIAWRAFCHVLGHWEMRGWGLFTITVKGDDRGLGTVGPWFPANWPEKELGWTIWDAADEGEGYVTEAARATREHVYRDLGWETAVSYIHLDNARSIAVAERLGCVRDDAADSPGDDGTDLVYRHPAPGSLT